MKIQCHLLALVLILFVFETSGQAEERRRIKAHFRGSEGQWIYALKFTPDDELLVSSDESSIKAWDVTTGRQRLRVVRNYRSPVLPVAVSPDGQHLVVPGAVPGTIELLNIKRRRATQRFDVWPLPGEKPPDDRHARFLFQHGPGYYALAVSPDGKTLAVGSAVLKLIDVESSEVRKLTDGDEPPAVDGTQGQTLYVRFSKDGKYLVTAHSKKGIRLWEIDQQKYVREFKLEKPGDSSPIAFSPESNRLAAVDGEAVVVWDVASGDKLQTLKPDARPTCLALSNDGTQLAVGRHGVDDANFDVNVELWNLTTGKRVRTLRSGGRFVSAPLHLAFSHDGKTLAGAGGGYIRIWDLETAKPAR